MSYGHRALVMLLLYLASSWLFTVVEGQRESDSKFKCLVYCSKVT